MTAPGPTDTGPVAWARRTFERFVPRGAILLTVLGLGYFAAGIVRNRVFANTYGAGAELDAYNAAFRIPEIALDVLVSAGLAAPFVPIFTTLRSRDDRAATEFGRTVITAAVGVSPIALAFLFVGAPWLATVVLPKADAATQDLYVQLLRINCFAQVMFAVSICLGEILVADRRFLPYALAPILYTGGIVAGTVLFAGTYGIVATAWGAVAGAAAHLGIRAAGILADDVPRPTRLRVPDRGVRRVRPPDDPADDQHAHRAADLHVPHPGRLRTGGRQRRRPSTSPSTTRSCRSA